MFGLKSTAEVYRYNEKLIVEIVMKYVTSLLEYDKNNSPFSMVSLEELHNYNFKALSGDADLPEIKISGIIDRVDLKDGRNNFV